MLKPKKICVGDKRMLLRFIHMLCILGDHLINWCILVGILVGWLASMGVLLGEGGGVCFGTSICERLNKKR